MTRVSEGKKKERKEHPTQAAWKGDGSTNQPYQKP